MRLRPALILSAACVVAACSHSDAAPDEALGCEPRRSWPEEEVTRWASTLLLRPDLRAGELGDVRLEYAGVPSLEGCITAATLAWDDRLDGGVVLVFPDGRASVHGGFADARAPFSAGLGRIGFVHTSMRGTSVLESRLRMLCARRPRSGWIAWTS